MTYERRRRIRPNIQLPTTHAWYLTYRAMREGREVGDVVSRMLRTVIAAELLTMSVRERRMLELSCPPWTRYDGERWIDEDEGSIRASSRTAEP